MGKMSTKNLPASKELGSGDGTGGSIPSAQAGSTPTSPATSGPTGNDGSKNSTKITGRMDPV